MNNQQLVELSEKIRDHLTTQKARAMADVAVLAPVGVVQEPRCRYRGDNGTKCAVGCLIPDERYHSELEGYSASHGMVMSAVFGDDVTPDDEHKAERLLSDWQHYHDHGDYGPWVAGQPWAKSPAECHQRALEAGAFIEV